MFRFASTLLVAASLSASVSAYTFNFHNNCGYTIWPAVAKAPNGHPDTSVQFGTQLDPGSPDASFNIDDSEIGIRSWARTGCDSTGANCQTGACNGGLECTDGGITAAAIYLETGYQAQGNVISWDLSHVDCAVNVPVSVNNNGNVKTCEDVNCPTTEAFAVAGDSQAITTSAVGTTFDITYCP